MKTKQLRVNQQCSIDYKGFKIDGPDNEGIFSLKDESGVVLRSTSYDKLRKSADQRTAFRSETLLKNALVRLTANPSDYFEGVLKTRKRYYILELKGSAQNYNVHNLRYVYDLNLPKNQAKLQQLKAVREEMLSLKKKIEVLHNEADNIYSSMESFDKNRTKGSTSSQEF